jgi:hypothetical protein
MSKVLRAALTASKRQAFLPNSIIVYGIRQKLFERISHQNDEKFGLAEAKKNNEWNF